VPRWFNHSAGASGTSEKEVLRVEAAGAGRGLRFVPVSSGGMETGRMEGCFAMRRLLFLGSGSGAVSSSPSVFQLVLSVILIIPCCVR